MEETGLPAPPRSGRSWPRLPSILQRLQRRRQPAEGDDGTSSLSSSRSIGCTRHLAAGIVSFLDHAFTLSVVLMTVIADEFAPPEWLVSTCLALSLASCIARLMGTHPQNISSNSGTPLPRLLALPIIPIHMLQMALLFCVTITSSSWDPESGTGMMLVQLVASVGILCCDVLVVIGAHNQREAQLNVYPSGFITPSHWLVDLAPEAKAMRRLTPPTEDWAYSSSVERRSRPSLTEQMDSQKVQATTCAICLSDFVDGEMLSRLTCGHNFHTECVKTWFRSNPCAYCPFRCPQVVQLDEGEMTEASEPQEEELDPAQVV